MRALKTLCGAAALVAFLAPGAHADEWNKRTYLTFSGPVQIPGATLPAGTYTFELANPDTTRHVIRVSEKDSGKPIGLFMTIPNDRLDAPSENLVMFSERAAGAPQAIQVWFYPGNRIGEEFVYPKNQAIAIAKANHKAVLATETSSNANDTEESRVAAMKGASVGRVDETGKMTSDTKAETTTARNDAKADMPAATTTTPKTTTAPKSTTAKTTTAKDTTARADTSNGVGTSGSAARRRSLPRTASNLAAIELLSVLSLAGAFGIRRVRRAIESR
jgi:hypothetical protein